jgi:ElaB/YqjD/DUF883 family membrane-anchored ribosome-binding protein
MTISERTERVLDRAARGDADIREIEDSISATRADLDRNLAAIEQQLSPDALIHQAVTYLRTSPGAFFSNFGDTVKNNPVPTVLLGVSLGWLMLNGRHRSADRVSASARGTEWDADAELYEDREFYRVGTDTEPGVMNNDGGSFGAVRRVRDAMRSTASSVSDRAADLSDSAADIRQRAGAAFDAAGEKVSATSEHAQEVFRRAREQVAHARRIIAQQPKRVTATAQDMVEHHPFVLGALAFAAGAAVAASLKRTRIEDDMMGSHRDQVLGEAQDRVRSHLEEGVASVRSALEEADTQANEGDTHHEPSGDEREPFLDVERDASASVTHGEPGQEQSAQDRFH